MLWEHRWFPVIFPLNQSIDPSHGHALSLQSIDLLRQTQFQLSLRLAAKDHGKTGKKTKKKLRLISTNSSRFQSLPIISNPF